MSPIWSSAAPLKSVSKGVWRAGEMRTCGRLLHSDPAVPAAAWDVTQNAVPRAQRGPAETAIRYVAKQGRSRLALHTFPSATSLGLASPIPWEDPCWVLEDHVLPVVQEERCMQRWQYCSEATWALSLCDLANSLRVPTVSSFS